MKFAIIETGGKQYKVSEGETFKTERLAKNMIEGDKVTFDKVLLVSDGKKTDIGTPYIPGVKIEATLVTEKKGRKVTGLAFKNKIRSKTTPYGHRKIEAHVKVGKI